MKRTSRLKKFGKLMAAMIFAFLLLVVAYALVIKPRLGLSFSRPVKIGEGYYNLMNGQKYRVVSGGNKCCEQTSYTYYEDQKWQIYWVGSYQASLGSNETTMTGPYPLPR